jgi:hypothetical protein
MVARELAIYHLDLTAVVEVRWDKGSTVRAGDYFVSLERETKMINWEQDFLYTTEHYHHLRDWSSLVRECLI